MISITVFSKVTTTNQFSVNFYSLSRSQVKVWVNPTSEVPFKAGFTTVLIRLHNLYKKGALQIHNIASGFLNSRKYLSFFICGNWTFLKFTRLKLSFTKKDVLPTTHLCILLYWHRISDNHIKSSNEFHFVQRHLHTHTQTWTNVAVDTAVHSYNRSLSGWLNQRHVMTRREVKITKHHDWLMIRTLTLTQWMMGDWLLIKKEACLHSDAVVYWQDWSLRLGPDLPYLNHAFYWHSARVSIWSHFGRV